MSVHSPTLFVNARPTQALLWLELVRVKGQTESDVKGHAHSLAHTRTHTRAVDASRFPSSHSQEDFMIGILGGSLLILHVLLGDVYPHLVWPLWTVLTQGTWRSTTWSADVVGGSVGSSFILHSFIPPSCLVLTASLMKLLWNVLCHDVKRSLF